MHPDLASPLSAEHRVLIPGVRDFTRHNGQPNQPKRTCVQRSPPEVDVCMAGIPPALRRNELTKGGHQVDTPTSATTRDPVFGVSPTPNGRRASLAVGSPAWCHRNHPGTLARAARSGRLAGRHSARAASAFMGPAVPCQQLAKRPDVPWRLVLSKQTDSRHTCCGDERLERESRSRTSPSKQTARV